MDEKPKPHGYKEGILKKTICSVSGDCHKAGDRVRYKSYKAIGDSAMLVDREYHVLNLQNMGLIRTFRLEIEGEELPDFYKLRKKR